MRKALVAGNWKMNKDQQSGKELLDELSRGTGQWPDSVEVMVAPPAPYLSAFVHSAHSRIGIGAQDVSAHPDYGAYTGEFSARMLRSTGVQYAIIAHSERRAYHGETDELAGRKIDACAESGIIPVYCCGEKLEEREAGRHVRVVTDQINTALRNLDAGLLTNLVVAYEPVWAIGTGKTATADQAQEMHAEIRKALAELFGSTFADGIRILYGGSCKPDNAAEIFAGPDVDGGLIGGAALNARDFMAIIEAAG